jgi:hypothetical protein
MALAFELTRIPGSGYIPRPEFMGNQTARLNENDGIWDVLGVYDASIGTITLYEDKIIDLAAKLSSGTSKVYPVLRELVRVHEHAHAYMQTASLFEGKSTGTSTKKDWFKGLPKDVNESLTEYIVVSILESGSWPPAWRTLFDEVDAYAPAYYKKWKQARRLRRGLEFIAPTVRFARAKIWRDWDEFYEALAEGEPEILTEAVLLRMTS